MTPPRRRPARKQTAQIKMVLSMTRNLLPEIFRPDDLFLLALVVGVLAAARMIVLLARVMGLKPGFAVRAPPRKCLLLFGHF